MERQKNIPKLRFPEFDVEWERKKLGESAELTSSKRVYLSDYTNTGIPFYRGKEITELKQGIEPSDILYISESSYMKFKETYGIPLIDDILMTAVGTLGNVLRINTDKPFYFKDGNLIWFRNIKEYSSFLEVLLHVNRKEVEKSSIGSTQRALTMVELRKLVFSFPPYPEQQKIASFFTAIDQRISQLKRKKILLEQYKKGLMQKIFSQEIRFKENNGQEFPKWEKKKIKDLVEIKYGKDQKQISCENGKYPILGTGGEMGRTNDFLTDKPSVLIGRKGTIDKPRYMDTPFWTVDTLFYTYVFANTNPKWLYYKFGTINWYLYNEASGVPSLSSSTIYTIPIILPTLPEQTKIANFLSAIDDKINNTQIQIEKAEIWKKGLLQKMFV